MIDLTNICVCVCVHAGGVVLSCRLSRQHSDLGTSLLNELLQVDLSQLFSQLFQLLLFLLRRKETEKTTDNNSIKFKVIWKGSFIALTSWHFPEIFFLCERQTPENVQTQFSLESASSCEEMNKASFSAEARAQSRRQQRNVAAGWLRNCRRGIVFLFRPLSNQAKNAGTPPRSLSPLSLPHASHTLLDLACTYGTLTPTRAHAAKKIHLASPQARD